MSGRIHPSKALGQHFLTDHHVLAGIVRLMEFSTGEAIVEVGPGKGSLTAVLLEEGLQVAAVEIDEQLAGQLAERFNSNPRFQVFPGDALVMDFATLINAAGFHPPVTVVSNFPYNVGTHLIRQLLPQRRLIRKIGGVLQAEVVRRITSPPGSKEYGFLSLFCQYFAEFRKGSIILPGAFYPTPKVRSMSFCLDLRPQHLLPPETENRFLKVLSAAFATRRKTLANNLAVLGLTASALRVFLAERGLSAQARAETLGLTDFLALAERADLFPSTAD